MTSREEYSVIAGASLTNARRLLRDSKKLRSTGSRGHACSSAILALEEGAKALVYFSASQGILRIVRKNPNYVTTFTESDLMKHEFKHAIVASEFEDWIGYGPFYAAMQNIRKGKLDKNEVVGIIHKAIHAHKRLRIDLMTKSSRYAKDVARMHEALKDLGILKNKGLYVDHRKGKMSIPMDIDKRKLDDLIDLAEVVLTVLGVSLRGRVDAYQKKVLMEEMRKSAAQVRRIMSRKPQVGPSPT